MKQHLIFIALMLLLPLLSLVFFTYTFTTDVDRVFLSISTFLFSIFTGFFISRQASRFNRVRETVTKFDGLMSGIYRSAGHVSIDLQRLYAEIIRNHYDTILSTGQWNIHFMRKSTTLVALHKGLDELVVESEVTKLSNQSLGAIIKSLATAQDIRKQMVALYKERIPLEQWVLIIIFAGMLIGTAATMPSAGMLFPSVVKSAFVVSVLSVLLILYRLNNLAFTERIMGEQSARDVLGIIDGDR